ncbi:IclR family transcriptional regulator [Geodermatophilus sp. CPCC 205506]|uniref:IclR family transcriptional regulator n=1 Tax=Geodermatophilus sp. CPCC 205506 TaxID=2936596 RepID=UPI003EE9E09C
MLEAMDPEGPLSASEIARRADLPVPTAHRIVNDLVKSGLLERDAERRFRTGLRLWELATRSSSALTLREVALPYMEDLHAVVRQHTQLSVLDRNDVLYVEKLTSRHNSSTNVTQPGSRLPVLACSPGLVLTAFAPPDERDAILTTAKTSQFTDATVVDRAKLRQIVTETRRAGYAVVSGWIHPQTAGVAVPVLGREGTAVAALSVTIPVGAIDDLTLIPALRTTARAISRAVRVADGQASDPRLSILRRRIRRATESS